MNTNPAALPQRTTDPALGLHADDQLVLRGPRMDFVLRPVPTRSGQRLQREVVVHPGAVAIVPVADDGRIVLIRNFRHTVGQELWELPAGTLEKGEDPARCAARELLEETGYEAQILSPFGWFFTSPGILTEKMYVFVASGLTFRHQELEDNEHIRVELRTQPEILTLIAENQLVDAKTIATLLKYFWRLDRGRRAPAEGDRNPQT